MKLVRTLCFTFLTCALAFPCTSSAEETRVPQFSDFPATRTYQGKAAKVQISSPEDKTYQTRLKEAGKASPDFAGEYVLRVWGCGTSCLYGAAVNLRTGGVVFLPGSICCWEGDGDQLLFRKNSRLVVIAGLVNESGEHGAHFYEFTGKAFRHLKTVPVQRR